MALLESRQIFTRMLAQSIQVFSSSLLFPELYRHVAIEKDMWYLTREENPPTLQKPRVPADNSSPFNSRRVYNPGDFSLTTDRWLSRWALVWALTNFSA